MKFLNLFRVAYSVHVSIIFCNGNVLLTYIGSEQYSSNLQFYSTHKYIICHPNTLLTCSANFLSYSKISVLFNSYATKPILKLKKYRHIYGRV